MNASIVRSHVQVPVVPTVRWVKGGLAAAALAWAGAAALAWVEAAAVQGQAKACGSRARRR